MTQAVFSPFSAQSAAPPSILVVASESQDVSLNSTTVSTIAASTLSKIALDFQKSSLTTLCFLKTHLSISAIADFVIDKQLRISQILKDTRCIQESLSVNSQKIRYLEEEINSLNIYLKNLNTQIRLNSNNFFLLLGSLKTNISNLINPIHFHEEELHFYLSNNHLFEQIESKILQATKESIKHLLDYSNTVIVSTPEHILCVSAQNLGIKLENGKWIQLANVVLSEQTKKIKQNALFIIPNFIALELTKNIASNPELIQTLDLSCPNLIESISLDLFNDPIILQCGHSFNRENIERLISDKRPFCPLCRHEFFEGLIENIWLNHLIKLLKIQADIGKIAFAYAKQLQPIVDRISKSKKTLELLNQQKNSLREKLLNQASSLHQLSLKVAEEKIELEQLQKQIPYEKREIAKSKLIEDYKRNDPMALMEIDQARLELEYLWLQNRDEM